MITYWVKLKVHGKYIYSEMTRHEKQILNNLPELEIYHENEKGILTKKNNTV